MKQFFLGIFIVFNFNWIDGEDVVLEYSHRNSKIWPVGVVRFRNDVCTSLEGLMGTCYTKSQCRDVGGIGSASCAKGIGTCCIYQRGCGDTSSYNNTYFVNTGYPDTQRTSTSCVFTIKKCSPDICQVRLDFLSLSLAQPDGNGVCVIDALTITGGASNIPRICGENTGQHVYVNFNADNDIKVIINTGAAGALSRSWNIKVTQVACDCPTLAPSGCLMYYRSVTGTVNSFNYGTTINGALITLPDGQVRPGTRQMVNCNYGVCVQMQPGYCSIRWSQGPDPTSFTVSNNTALQEVIPGLPSGGLVGDNCTTDYVIVPNPYYANGSAVNADRFCGNQFPAVTTASKPFVLTVVTDGDDMTDVANRGFSLNFQQIPCGTPTLITV